MVYQIEDLALMKCVILANRSSFHFPSQAVRKRGGLHNSAVSPASAFYGDDRTLPCREDSG